MIVVLAVGALLVLARPGVATADTLAERQQEVEAMPPEQQAELARQHARFASLAPAEQERLRRLDADLAADPERDELRRVMRSYHEWLKTLEPAEREELRGLSPADRVKRVQELRQKQSERRARLLTAADLEVFGAWLEEQIRAKAAPEDIARWDKMAPDVRRGAVLAEFWHKPGANRPRKKPLLTEEQIAALRDRLSPAAQKLLDACASTDDRQRLLVSWMFQMQGDQFSRGGRTLGAQRSDDLQRFFESKLSPDEQRDLLTLPSQERGRWLWSRYRRSQEVDRAWRELETMLAPEPPVEQPAPAETPQPSAEE